MKRTSSSIIGKINRESVRAFFEGKYYPVLIALLVAVGSVSGEEYYLNMLHSALVVTALIMCDTIKPFIISLITYVYQVSLSHAPGYPSNSNYYLTAWRLPVSIIIITAIVAAFVFFIAKNKIYKRISPKTSPFLLPLLLFSAALLLNGAFSEKWWWGNLTFALANILVYLVLFTVIYHGFREDERAEDLASYFAYISALIAAVLFVELAALYLTSDNVLVDGSINKVGVALGWGIWNMIGVSAAVLIPVCFLGMERNKYPWLYFATASVAYITALLSMSRNALVFASLAYAACVIILAIRGKHRRVMRVITVIGVVGVAAFAVIFWDKISRLIADNINITGSGDASNGRFTLWSAAFDAFKSAPVFGSGFYSMEIGDVFGLTPKMAHNTALELLSATGIFGTCAYIWYRVATLKPFIKRPTLVKTMLGISILVLLAESMLDNFIFNIYPMFHALTALAIAARLAAEEPRDENETDGVSREEDAELSAEKES